MHQTLFFICIPKHLYQNFFLDSMTITKSISEGASTGLTMLLQFKYLNILDTRFYIIGTQIHAMDRLILTLIKMFLAMENLYL